MTIYKNARGELVITKAHLTLPMKIAKKRHAKKEPADDKREQEPEKAQRGRGGRVHSYSLNWYYDMVGKNWEAYNDVVGSLPQFEEDEITEAIDKYIETHEDEVVLALDDYESQPTRQELVGEDVMTDEELKAHKAKKEADRDAMVRNAISLVVKNEILILEEKASCVARWFSTRSFLGIRSRGCRNGQKCVQRKMLSKVGIKVQARGDGMIKKMLSRAFQQSWGCECLDC